MTIPPDHIYKLCTSKRAYKSRKNAENFLRSVRKSGVILPPNATAYKCPFGNHWHTGHKKEYEVR